MKVLDINKKKSGYRKKLCLLEKDLTFNALLEVINYCLEHEYFDCKDLLAFWQKHNVDIEAESCLPDWSKYLRKFQVSYNAPTNNVTNFSSEQIASASDLIESIRQLYEIQDDSRPSYSWFFPSYVLKYALEQEYPDDLNPGKIIATNLDLLFPSAYPAEYEELLTDYVYEPFRRVPFDSPLRQLLKEVSLWTVERSVQDERLHACYSACLLDLFDPENREGRERSMTLQDVFALLQHAPQELYYSWIHGWLLDSELPYKLSLDEFKKALLCFSFGKGNDALGLNPEYSHMVDPEHLEMLYQLPDDSSNNKYLSFKTLLWYIYKADDNGIEFDDDCNELISKFMSNLTRFRSQYLSGVSPVAVGDMSNVGSCINYSIGIEETDLLVTLSGAEYHIGELNLLPESQEASFQELFDYYNERQNTYLLLFSKAHSEGLNELAISLLSLYIFYRAILLQGRFGNLGELSSTIEIALTLPGAKVLRHTLAFVVDSIDEHFSSDPFARASARILRQFVPQGAELKVLPGRMKEGAVRGEEEVSAFLQRHLGMERWEKLSINSQDCLVSAELQWRNSSVEFGFGIKDWSGLITTYCKPIEGELIERLKGFYYSSEYATYLNERGLKRPAKPTAGWLLKDFKVFSEMPETVQEAVKQSGTKLHEDIGLVNSLYDLVQNYRNIAAHPDAVSASRFTDFKKKLFQERVLQRFIDAVC